MWVRMVSWQGGRKASFCVILRCALHCTACLCRALWQVRSPALATPLSTFFFYCWIRLDSTGLLRTPAGAQCSTVRTSQPASRRP